MPDNAVTDTVLVAPGAELSLVELFLQAHIVVKIVIVGLLLASIWSWAIIIDKWLLYSRVRRQMTRFESVFWSGQSLEELYRSLSGGKSPTAIASVFIAAMREWKRSFETGASSPIGLQNRIDKVLDVAIGRETERLGTQTAVPGNRGIVGTIHRTVRHRMGHYDKLSSDCRLQEYRACRRSPGIAEALLATALGLLAAIPAVVAYNKFSNDASKISQRLEGFADEFSAHSQPPDR